MRSPPLFPPDGQAPPPPPECIATATEKRHGRLEQRPLRATAILTLHGKWPGLKQGFELIRRRPLKGKTTEEVVYGICSLAPERANAQRLLELTRGHWGIENKLHYVRDVTLGEDGCRVRKGSAPQVLAAVRPAVIHLLAGVEAPSHAAALRRLNHHPEEALALLDLPQLQ